MSTIAATRLPARSVEPGAYEDQLGPMLIQWAADQLREHVHVPPAGRVLELACGTGIATEALRRALPEGVRIAASDLDSNMLDHAEALRGHLPGVAFCRLDAEDVLFPDQFFDAVVCQFGLAHIDDPLEALHEAVRVLRPGGQLVFSVWNAERRNPPAKVVNDIVRGMLPDEDHDMLARPFALHDRDRLVALFRAAGAVEIEVEPVRHVIEAPSARHAARALVGANAGIVDLATRCGVPLDRMVFSATGALRSVFGSYPFRAPVSAVVVRARKRL